MTCSEMGSMSALQSWRAICLAQYHQHTPVSPTALTPACSLALDYTTVGDLGRKLYSAQCWGNTGSGTNQLHSAVDVYLSGSTNISDWNPRKEMSPIHTHTHTQPFTWLGVIWVNGSLLNIWFFNMAFGNLCLLFSVNLPSFLFLCCLHLSFSY